MKTRWIMTAMILLAASGRAAVITATQNGQINDSTTWGGATLPVAGDTDTWDTAGYWMSHGTETFHGGLLSVNSAARLQASANANLTLQATVFDNGTIFKATNGASTYDFSGQALTFAGGGALFYSNGQNRNIFLGNAVWAGNGDILFSKAVNAVGTSLLTLKADNTLSNYTGTISVNNSTTGGVARLTIEAATTGSFGVKIGALSQLDVRDETATYTFSTLVLGDEAIAAGTYAYTDFTVAQRAYLLSDGSPGTVTVIQDPPATNGLVWLDFATSEFSVDGILPTSPVLGTNSFLYTAETNFYYDISGLDIGGVAATVELNIVSVNGMELYQVGELGLAVAGGASTNWWESGEDLEFTLTLLDAGGNDVSSGYYVDLVGVEMRYRLNGANSATFNGGTVSSAAGGITFSTHDLSVGDEDEFFVQASRNSSDVAQLSALRFNLVPKDVTTEEPAEIVAIRPVAGGLLELEINAPTPGLSCLKGKDNLVYGTWARVPHSDDGVNEFKQDTLSYSTAAGSNVLIYVQGDASSAFFGTGPQ